tara:strand:+ start:7410 stop:7961 length:552 start_codon:yes stop_codon:yes gene_type:complete
MNKEQLREFFREYLQDIFTLDLLDYSLQEFADSESTIKIKVKEGEKARTLKGSGVGLLDSAYSALFSHYQKKHTSLNTLALHDAYFQIDHKAEILKSNMRIKIQFKNSRGYITDFTSNGSSMGLTGVTALVDALSFYVNCETLFHRMRHLIKDAKDRGRGDVLNRYTYVLGQVVEVNDYSIIT